VRDSEAPFGPDMSMSSGESLTPVSLRASSGVRTTIAPEPRVPERGPMSSLPRTRCGSEILMILAGVGVELGVGEERDSQCIVLDREGRRERWDCEDEGVG
jgi:hypothetical protein